MLEQDAVNVGCEADLVSHVLDVKGRQLSVKGLLDTGVVVSFMLISTLTIGLTLGFDSLELIPTKIRVATFRMRNYMNCVALDKYVWFSTKTVGAQLFYEEASHSLRTVYVLVCC